MEKKDFLNYDNVYETFLNLFKEVVEDYGYDYDYYEEEVSWYADNSATETLESMKQYVHQKSTRMDGNFANIREDWDDIPNFVESEVKPWGKFDDIVKSIDDGTISDEDLQKFQTWALDWFFTAFGTFGLKYNFGEFISDREYDRRREYEEEWQMEYGDDAA